jgi:plasmid stabilization system protein ParE
MYKVAILPIAKQDIKEAAHWYNSKQKELGKRFTLLVRQKINLLKQNPLAAATRYDEVKTAALDVFPFMIHYTIDEQQNLIVVTAVLHTSRNPDIWKQDRENSDVSE